jgi:exodeoxyribonuclease V alpha subunit
VANVSSEKVSAHLNHIRFQNYETGFVIGLFQGANGDGSRGEFAGLGSMIHPEVGLEYQLFGKWVDNAQWGRQFQFQAYEVIRPKDVDGIYRYIVRTKWVGPAIGKKLVEQYGPETLDVLRDDPDRVARDIKGITPERAAEIQTDIRAHEEIESAMVELEKIVGGMGLKGSLAMDLVQKWGCDAPEVIRENPYKLTEIRGIGFPSADQVAVDRVRINPASVYRQEAAVLHMLHENLAKGNTWIRLDALMVNAIAAINTDVTEGFESLVSKRRVVSEKEFVALERVARDEMEIAERMRELTNDPTDI